MNSNHRTAWEGIFEDDYEEKVGVKKYIPLDMERKGMDVVSIS